MAHPLRGKTACVGLATAGCGEAPGRNAMEIMVEAVHGTAPALAGHDRANPTAHILSAAMLLRHSLGLESEANAVERAVLGAIEAGVLTADLAPRGATPATTREVGTAVVERIRGA